MWSIRLKYTEIEKTPSELFAGHDYFTLLPSKYSLDLGKWEFGDKNQQIYKYTWSILEEKKVDNFYQRYNHYKR